MPRASANWSEPHGPWPPRVSPRACRWGFPSLPKDFWSTPCPPEAQFSHIIAGSVDCAYLVFNGIAGWGDFITRFFVPTLLGNICGGVALVAALNYGQVAPEVENNE